MRKLTAVASFLLLTAFIRTVEDRIDRISSDIDSTVGVAALHLESGRRIVYRADERFPMGSVNKFPIAVAFMREVDAGRFSLSSEVEIGPNDFAPNHSPIRVAANGQPVRMTLERVVQAMLRDSDNTAADLLLRLSGGPAAVSRTIQTLGVNGIDVTRNKRQLAADLDGPGATEAYAVDPRDTATPVAMLTLLERFYGRKLGLSPASHDFLMRLMTESPTGERRIRAGAPADAVVAHKTGTMPGTVNDVGIITSPDGRHHVLVAVFTKGGRTSTMTEREKVVADITRAIYRDFVGWTPYERTTQ